MKYGVEFEEIATVIRTIQCEVEADSEDEIEQKIKMGDYEFIDSWDEDDIDSKFKRITDIEEAE